MADLVGVLPAAGRGLRAAPRSRVVPKAMFDVGGMPAIRRNVELMRDQLGIHDIRIAIGHRGEVIRDALGDGRALGVRLDYAENERVDLGLPYSIALATRDLEGFCCVVLADECYVGSNHAELLTADYASAAVTCGVIEAEERFVRENYAVEIAGERIVRLEEKPPAPNGRLMGVGTYVLHPSTVVQLRAAFAPDAARGPRDWTSWIDEIRARGALVRPFRLRGSYVNINTHEDLERANRLVRTAASCSARAVAAGS
jgi:NDP-sugar pyrophosphorylase family protein